jgi:hypothetical protein
MDPLDRDPLIRSFESHLYAENRSDRTVRDGDALQEVQGRPEAAASDTAPRIPLQTTPSRSARPPGRAILIQRRRGRGDHRLARSLWGEVAEKPGGGDPTVHERPPPRRLGAAPSHPVAEPYSGPRAQHGRTVPLTGEKRRPRKPVPRPAGWHLGAVGLAQADQVGGDGALRAVPGAWVLFERAGDGATTGLSIPRGS